MADQFGTAHKRTVRPTRERSRGRRLLVRLVGLAGLEARIVWLRARIRARRLALAALLIGLSAALGTTALVLLDVAVYLWLRVVMPASWAMFIMALVHAIGAALLFVAARNVYRTPTRSKSGLAAGAARGTVAGGNKV